MGKHKKEKKHKKDKKKRKSKHRSSSESGSTSDEWIEKSMDKEKPFNKEKSPKKQERDEWLSLPTTFSITTNEEKKLKSQIAKRQANIDEQYNPSTNVRELNPYWKDGGSGLPSLNKFKKPEEQEHYKDYKSSGASYKHQSSWRKQSTDAKTSKTETQTVFENRDEEEIVEEPQKVLSEKELNALASKIVKAEIMGNLSQAKELQKKLDDARELRKNNPQQAQKDQEEDVILTEMDSRGYSRPLKNKSNDSEVQKTGKKKKQKVETHQDGERLRYYADDDKYSLKEMFENEKFNSIEDQNREFLRMASNIRKNDDLDELFTDNVRRTNSNEEQAKSRAIGDHQKIAKSLDNCTKCIQSDNMVRSLVIATGSAFYLSLPPFEPLTDGHCFIIPVRHCPCSTQLEENEWEELSNFRRSLCEMFAASDEEPIFFETCYALHRFPHMVIECVPMNKEIGDLAPIYFKKAIDESETEWATNKKLVSLKGKDVRRAVPKGLPYFAVTFGARKDDGFAHVIEDEKLFPRNFAQEIIGGMLDLHHGKWRKPRKLSFDEQSKKVVEFTRNWAKFDHTK